MVAVLQHDREAFLQADGSVLNKRVALRAERLLDLLLGPKNPWIPLGGAAEEHAVHAGLAHPAPDVVHVFEIAVAENQRRRIFRDLDGAGYRLPIGASLVTLPERAAVDRDDRRILFQ